MASQIFLDIGPLRRFPNFRRLFVGFGIRQIGAQITVTTVIYQVYSITHSNLDVGLISIAQVVPGIITPIIGGAIADSMDRRKLLVITAVTMSFASVGLAMNCYGNHPQLWVLYACSAATWALNGVDQPTRRTVSISLVDRDAYITSNILLQFVSQFSQFAGPAAAGLLIAFLPHNLAGVYWIDVASTAAALWCVLRLPKMPPAGGGTKFSPQSILEGFRFLKGRKVLQACFITDINATLLGLPTSLFPYMAAVHFHGGSKTFGLLAASASIGAITGGMLSAWTRRIRFQGRAVLVAVAVWGFSLAGFGIVPWLWAAVVLLAIAGWANQVSAILRNTILQIETPDELRGRLNSINSISVQVGKLGNAEAGLVAALSTVQISIVSGGLGSVLGVLLIAKAIPSFARYRLDRHGHNEDDAVTT